MSRIRTIKPEFWRHEELSALPEATHMLAAALLNYADDDGYFNANPRLIQADCFPLREPSVSVPVSLQQLAKTGYLRLGTTADGKRYGHIFKFSEHQVISHKKPSKLMGLEIIWDTSIIIPVTIQEASAPEGNGIEGNRTGKGKEGAYAPNARARRSEAFGDFWKVFPKRLGTNSQAKAEERFNAIIKSGVDPPVIIAGALRYAAHCDDERITATRFTQKATTWLNEQGWENEYPEPNRKANQSEFACAVEDIQLAIRDREQGTRNGAACNGSDPTDPGDDLP